MATMKKPAKKMQMGGMADSYTNYKMGGTVKAKNGKSFPDLNKDGKITKADILKGRGVIAQKGATVKKPLSPAPKKKGAMDAMKDLGKYVSTFGLATEGYNPADGRYSKSKKKMQYGGKAASMVPMKKGGVVKKAGMHKMPNGSMMKNSMMKMGGKMAKQAAVAIAMKKAGKTPKKKMQYGGAAASMKPTSMMKKGGKMKMGGKCKNGC